MTPLKVCLVCDVIFSLAVLAGCSYAVFWLGNSGWWFALAILVCTMWQCTPYKS